MSAVRALALLALSAAAACKQPGTIAIDLDGLDACPAATRVQVYLIAGATCACTCAECVASCRAETCTVGCPPEGCPLSSLDDGLALTPPAGGQYAVVYQLRDDSGPLPVVVATACAVVTVGDDGTGDQAVTAATTCCPASDSP
jgi:hypothetical protein